MKVVILGKGLMLSNLIEGTLDAECEIVGVFRYERTKYNSFFLKIRDFFTSDMTLIKQHRLHEIKCKSANSEGFKKELLKLNADVMLVGTWGEKLKKEVIDIPAIASVNVHPSFLPKYRGPNPYLQTILHGEMQSGITFHLINEKFDGGPILSQKHIQIFPSDTSKELRERTVFQARLLCAELLKKLEYGLVIPLEQNESEVSYYPNIADRDKMLDFEKETAKEIHSRIRALYPWLPTYVSYKDKFFIPNPYKLKIIDAEQTKNILKNMKNPKAGDMISKNPDKKSITVLCKDFNSIKMDGIKAYGFLNKYFTKQIIKNIILE